MKSYILTLFFCLCFACSYAQLKVYDSKTRQPIEYAKVYARKSKYLMNTDNKGVVKSKGLILADTFKVIAVGYESNKVLYTPDLKEIFLNKKLSLDVQKEVIVRKNEVVKDGALESKEAMLYDVKVLQAGQFFAPRDIYKSHPYLDGLSVRIMSSKKGQSMNVSVRAVDKDGEPGDYIYDKNIICKVDEGHYVVHIDLKDKYIKLPAEGFFICFSKVVQKKSDLKQWLYVSASPGERDFGPEDSVFTMRADNSGFKWIPYKGYTVSMQLELSN
jgi:hypothetical protein